MMRSKYNCPKCGDIPIIDTEVHTEISCCRFRVQSLYFSVAVHQWKKLVKLFEKGYEFDSHGLPIVDLTDPPPNCKPPRKP